MKSLLIGRELTLKREDSAILVNELIRIQKDSYKLGKALNLPKEMLADIGKRNQKLQLIRVIEEFLAGKNPPPTWNRLIRALHSIKLSNVARRLETTYCKLDAGIIRCISTRNLNLEHGDGVGDKIGVIHCMSGEHNRKPLT